MYEIARVRDTRRLTGVMLSYILRYNQHERNVFLKRRKVF